jgi:putative tricarboxylic transport membrane protein
VWLEGFLNALSLGNILWLLLGTLIGLVIGVLPALGANFGVALMLPLTFGMDPATAIIFLVAIHAACNYGDSVASIVINVPGGPGTVATCWDGYPMAQQGKAGKALGIATLSSFIGGSGTWLFLALLVGPVTKLALSIGAPEYFALGVMALGLVSVASKGETIKGLIMAMLGLALSTVGQDEVTGLTYRFSCGILSLEAGIPIVVSTLGVFALSQVLIMLEEGGSVAKAVAVKDSILSGFPEVIKRPLTVIRAGMVGWFIGILPALGVSLAGIASYLVEKKYSREGKQFGNGAPGGLAAAEVGKGACVVGDLIPTFTLGVPGSVTGAILMAALIIQGIEPGPRFLLKGSLPYTVFAGIVLAQATFLVSGVLFGKLFTRIVYCPNAILAPVITVLTLLGAFAERNNSFDIGLALAFGVFAYLLEKLKYPTVCMVLGLILGPLVEANFHRSLGISFGSYAIFVNRPLTFGMLLITAAFLTGPYLWWFLVRRKRTSKPDRPAGEAAGQAPAGEMVLLAGISGLLAAFLIASQGYSAASRLFPSLIAAGGLIFIAMRFLGIARRLTFGTWTWLYPGPLFKGHLSWQWSLLTMIGYVAAIHLAGFVPATLVYVPASILLSGDPKTKRALGIGLAVAVSVYVFSKLVHLQLPLGLLEALR